MKHFLHSLDSVLTKSVSALVVLMLGTMILLSFTQVILRNFFSSGIGWADMVLRYLVIGVGMFGAVLAARQGRQIAIDVLSRTVPERFKPALSWIIGLFTITVSIAMARAAMVFVHGERQFGTEIYPGVDAWWFQLLIPVGFLLIALQVLLNLLQGKRVVEAATPRLTKNDEVESEASGDAV